MAKHSRQAQAKRRKEEAELREGMADVSQQEEPPHIDSEDYEHESPTVEEMIDVAEWLPNDGTQNNAYPAAVTQPDYQRKSKRTRLGLAVVIALLAAIIAGLAYVGMHLVEQANVEAEDALNQALKTGSNTEGDILLTQDDVDKHTKALATIPNLANMLGKTPDSVIMTLGSAIQVDAKPIEEEKSSGDAKDSKETNDEQTKDQQDTPTSHAMRYTIAFNREGSVTTNIKTLYLVTNDGGIIIDAGYATSLSDLSYGDASFKDAVESERLIDAVLISAGAPVEDGEISLPEDESKYRETKGGNLVKESYTFTGVSAQDDTVEYTCRLTFDYSTATTSGNLDDTVKQIYVSLHRE